jgi:hypothetical protein
MATTTNYSWTTPDDTDLVKDGAAAIRTLGSSIDTSVKALSPGTTAGDVDYYTTSTAKARLAIGTAGQLLRVNSGATAPEWFTQTSGGMTLINTGGTTLTGTTVTISSIPATYKNLQLIIREYKPVTDNVNMRMRFNGDSATRYRELSANSAGTNFNSTEMLITNNQDNGVATGLSVVDIYDYANTTTWKMMTFLSMAVDATTTTNLTYRSGTHFYNQIGAIDSISLYNNTGDFTSGTAFLYGVN